MLDASWQERRSSPKKFRMQLAAVGLNQTTASRYFGISIRTIRRMAAGTAKVPDTVTLLMYLMRKHNEDPDVPVKKKRRRR